MNNLPSIRSLHLPLMMHASGSRNPIMEPPPNFPKKIVFYGREYQPNYLTHTLDNVTVVMNEFGERGLLFQVFNQTNDRPHLQSEIGSSRLFRALSSRDFPLAVLPFAVLFSIQYPIVNFPKTIIYNGNEYISLSGLIVSEKSLSVSTLHAEGPKLKFFP